jgi:hypothetical protein
MFHSTRTKPSVVPERLVLLWSALAALHRCLSEYSQINDGTYYLPLSSDEGVTVVDNVPTFTACTEECDKAQCQLITYDYNTKKCYVRVSIAPILEG